MLTSHGCAHRVVRYLAKSTQMHSESFRTYIRRLANAGMHQTTSRPKAVFVGSIRCARLISS